MRYIFIVHLFGILNIDIFYKSVKRKTFWLKIILKVNLSGEEVLSYYHLQDIN
jgi:hypothetical protein